LVHKNVGTLFHFTAFLHTLTNFCNIWCTIYYSFIPPHLHTAITLPWGTSQQHTV